MPSPTSWDSLSPFLCFFRSFPAMICVISQFHTCTLRPLKLCDMGSVSWLLTGMLGNKTSLGWFVSHCLNLFIYFDCLGSYLVAHNRLWFRPYLVKQDVLYEWREPFPKQQLEHVVWTKLCTLTFDFSQRRVDSISSPGGEFEEEHKTRKSLNFRICYCPLELN